jgi:GTP-binding protein
MMDRFKSANFVTSASNQLQCPPSDRAEFALIGRSNVWKSSLINAICDRKDLAKTSSKPGKTQLINYYSIYNDHNDQGYLVDLPWYGYANKSQNQRAWRADMISDYLSYRSNLSHIFVLIDSRLKPQTIDLSFIERLYHQDRPFTLVYTKSDQAKPKDITHTLHSMYTEISKFIYPLPSHLITSSTKKQGIWELISAISDMLDEKNI